MNIEEARKVLEVGADVTGDALKKVYRKKAAKYHPDTCKDEDASAKFKAVTEAYGLLSRPRKPLQMNRGFSFPPASTEVSISFRDAVLGCKPRVSIETRIRCEPCEGNGIFDVGGTCTACNGTKMVTMQMGPNMMVRNTCPKCFGTGIELEPCSECHGECTILKKKDINVFLRGGVANGQIIPVKGAGHYTSNMFGKFHEALLVKVNVAPDEHMKLLGLDVHSKISLPLKDAVLGAEIEVETVHGKKMASIPKLSKHGQHVIIEKSGALSPDGTGDHVVELDVEYPANIADIVSSSDKD